MKPFHRPQDRNLEILLGLLLVWAACSSCTYFGSECRGNDLSCSAGMSALLGSAAAVFDSEVAIRKRIFLTVSGVLSPAIGVAALDATCNSDPNRPTTDTYKALLGAPGRRACLTPACGGGSAEHAGWVLLPNTSYYTADGITLIGQTNVDAGIFTFPLAAAWTGAGAAHTWTGLIADWTTSGETCTSWTAAGATGMGGTFGATTTSALESGSRSCVATWPSLICVSQ